MSKNDLEKLNEQLLKIKCFIYDSCGFNLSEIYEEENKDYGAYKFKLNNSNVCFRTAKITPTKVGQFVTFWKRNSEDKKIWPYDISDNIDYLVISVCNKKNFGQFVFPKSVLSEKRIISKNGIGGKRALRVYPPWDKVSNKQAENTQSWQLQYFLNLSENKALDISFVKTLYSQI